jgi:hypothetical protein
MKKSLHIDANNVNGKYNISIIGEGFDTTDLEKLFDHMQILSEDDSDYIITYPVIRELEDPDFMDEMDRRIDDIKNGNVKTVPFDTLRKKYLYNNDFEKFVEENPNYKLDCDEEDE